MKKILYIAISSQTGGVPKHILNALQSANANGCDITVAVPADGDYYPWFQREASATIPLSLNPYSFKSLWLLRKYIKEHGIELVHSHGKGAGMYARPLKLLCPGVKVVHTFHGIYLERYGTLVRKIYCTIEHLLRKWTDVFICVSESEKEEALRLGFAFPERTEIIYNGVDVKLFQSTEVEREDYLKEFNFPENTCIAGCVARLEYMKGHRYLIEAFKSVCERHPQCRLILVGDGPDRQQIEALVQKFGLEEKVILTGFRHDIPRLLKIFDIFVSASLKEGMPYTLIEALAAGIPVVATDVIGNRDVIQDGYNGLLARPENSGDLAEKICQAIEYPEDNLRYVRAGAETTEKKFTVDVSVHKLYEVYKGLLGK